MAQTGKGIIVGYKVESAYNTAPGATGAKQLRLTPSPGLSVKKALIESQEVRSDGQNTMARHGSRNVDGSYTGELIVGAYDEIIQAVMRSTWVAALAITEATAGLTSITTTTSTIVATAGSWITAGVRVGDVIRLTGHSTAANNNINLRVKSLSATTITVHGTPLTVNAVADTSFTVTVLKKLINGATPTRRTFYIDEYNQDIDLSEVFGGCRWIGMKITGSPDGMANVEFTVLGGDGTTLATGASPYYTSPTLPSGTPLVFADATVSFGGTDIQLTAFELNIVIAAKTEPVIGNNGVSPDVFDNDMKVTGSISMIRADFTNVTNYLSETEVELHVLLVEPEAEPKDCISFFVPRVKLTAADAPIGNDGAMIETLPFTTGKKDAASGYDATTLTICTSAA